MANDNDNVGQREPRMAIEPLAVDGATAARMCGMSRRTWARLRSEGLLPDACQIGSCSKPLWRVEALRKWAAAGFPPGWREGGR